MNLMIFFLNNAKIVSKTLKIALRQHSRKIIATNLYSLLFQEKIYLKPTC